MGKSVLGAAKALESFLLNTYFFLNESNEKLVTHLCLCQ